MTGNIIDRRMWAAGLFAGCITLAACSAQLAEEGADSESELDSTEQALASSGGFMLRNTNTYKCLTVATANGSNAYLSPCNSASSSQRWGFDGGLLKNAASGLCLDIEAASLYVGAPAQVFSCTGGANQDFRFYPWLTAANSVVTNWHMVVKHSGLCLEPGGASGLDAIQSNRCNSAWNLLF
jgi:hypothetical protein